MANMFELKKKKREKRKYVKIKNGRAGRAEIYMFLLFINYADLFCPSSPSLSSLHTIQYFLLTTPHKGFFSDSLQF